MHSTTSNTGSFNGCEFTIFRAKVDVSDEQLIASCKKMEKEFLSGEEGFIQHSLLKGDDGSWADVVFTKSKEDAEHICRKFMENQSCLDYLRLIDESSVNLTFWSRAK